MDIEHDIAETVIRELSPKRYRHTLLTVELCVELAKRFNLDRRRAWIASMWHDIAREWDEQKLEKYVSRRSIAVEPLERKVPMLLHGPVAAELLEERYVLDDREIWNAVRWHTTGHPDMGALGYALFAADYLEPGRTHISREDQDTILAAGSLERMICEIYRRQFAYFVKAGITVEPKAVMLFEQLEKTIAG